VGKFAAADFLDPQHFYGLFIKLNSELLTFEEVAERLSRVSYVQMTVRFRMKEETRELIESKKMPVIELKLWAKNASLEYHQKALDKCRIKLVTLEEHFKREKGRPLETLGVRRE
jgi:hypothetical protein